MTTPFSGSLFFFYYNIEITKAIDYENSYFLTKGKNTPVKDQTLPIAQVFSFSLRGGSRITARPSGTEPKIKFYLNLTGTNKKSLNELETTILKKIELLVKTAK